MNTKEPSNNSHVLAIKEQNVGSMTKRRAAIARKKKNIDILARANLLPASSWSPIIVEAPPLAKIIPFPRKKELTFPSNQGYPNKDYLYPLFDGQDEEENNDGVTYDI